MTRIVVGVWSVQTYDKAWANMTIETRLGYTQEAIETCLARRAALGAAQDPARNLTAVFAAPEYLFASTWNERGLHLDHEELERFKRHFKTTYVPAGAVLFPGSIATRKRLTAVRRERYLNRYAAHLERVSTQQVALREALRDAPYRADKRRIHLLERLATQSGPLWDHPAVLEDQVAETHAAMTRMRSGQEYVSRNTAYGFFRGRKIIAYHKRTSVSDLGTENTAFMIGTEPVAAFVGSTSFGVELCRDAKVGYIGHHLSGSFDVQVLLSATLESSEIARKYKKLLIHACNLREHSGVWHRTLGPLEPAERVEVRGHRLDLYAVEI